MTQLFRLKKLALDERGNTMVMIVLVMCAIMALTETFMRIQENQSKAMYQSQIFASRDRLMTLLSTSISDGISLRNSRFADTNPYLYCCLMPNSPGACTGPTGGITCSETQTYDMALYSPSPALAGTGWSNYALGGAATPLPNAVSGGDTFQPLFYTLSGMTCPGVTAPTRQCPLQAVTQFTPLCSGTMDQPSQSLTPGPCTGPALGVRITVSVKSGLPGIILNQAGKAQNYPVGSKVFF